MMKGFGVLPVIMIPSSLVGPLLIRKTWISRGQVTAFHISFYVLPSSVQQEAPGSWQWVFYMRGLVCLGQVDFVTSSPP